MEDRRGGSSRSSLPATCFRKLCICSRSCATSCDNLGICKSCFYLAVKTYCDFSSRIVCRLLPKTQHKPFSAHRLQGGPLSSIKHLIYQKVNITALFRPEFNLTFCLRQAVQALTFLEIIGGNCCSPFSASDQVLFDILADTG